ncbi:MAG: hypothetical protein WCW93_01080 [Candidatus Paceibacterota bacterium]
MNIKISGIENRGDLEKERIVFNVLADDDAGRYIVLKSRKIGEDKVSVKPSAILWFTDQEVKKDDFVILYTKKGIYKSSKNEAGNTSHFFYWDKETPIWNNDNDAVVLVNANTWEFKFLKEKENA